MATAVEELDRLAELCPRLDLAAPEHVLADRVLQPLASLVGADTASLRRFGIVNGTPTPLSIVDFAIADSVREAYLERYFLLDPLRGLLARRLHKPLFPSPVRQGEWSGERAAPAKRAELRDDFRRYRREFLLPNRFYYHLGFCVPSSAGEMIAFDFHRPQGSSDFGAIEGARARIVAGYLHAAARVTLSVARQQHDAQPPAALTSREAEVAAAVTSGLSNKQIAERLDISVRTVENHLRSIFAKCGVTTRTQLAASLRRG